MMNQRTQQEQHQQHSRQHHQQQQQQQQQQQEMSKSKTRNVRFADEEQVDKDETHTTERPSSPLLPVLTEEACRDLWYQHDEISALKRETRNLVLYGQPESGDDMTGLDRYGMERSKHKRSVIRYVLMGSKQRRGPEFLRMISVQSTEWARKVAVDQGFRDFCDVYDPLAGMLGFCDKKNSNSNGNDDSCDEDDDVANVFDGVNEESFDASIFNETFTPSNDDDTDNDNDVSSSSNKRKFVEDEHQSPLLCGGDRRVRARTLSNPIAPALVV